MAATTYDDLKLYVKTDCPYCARVDRFCQNAGIEIEHLNIADGTNGEDLERIGGKRTCPCLLIDGKPMYESMDIIKYLAGRAGIKLPGQK
jgi:glutaredoxin